MSEDALHHIIQWNVEETALLSKSQRLESLRGEI